MQDNKDKLVSQLAHNNAEALYILSKTELDDDQRLNMVRTAARCGIIDAIFDMSNMVPNQREHWLKTAYTSGSTSAAFQWVRLILENKTERDSIEEDLLILNRLSTHVTSHQLADCHYLKGRAYSLRFISTISSRMSKAL